MSYQSVTILGNCCRDVQIKNLPGGTQVAECGIASSRKWADKSTGEQKEETMFIDFVCFGKLAEIVGKFAAKGKQVLLVGHLKLDQWDDKQSGAKRSKHVLVVDQFKLTGSRDGGGQSIDRSSNQDRPSRPAPSQRPKQPPVGDEQQFDEKDIPFGWEGRHQQGI